MPTKTIYGGMPDEDGNIPIYFLLITGDRNWVDSGMVFRCIESVAQWCEEQEYELHVVHGGAPGADTCADEAAKALELPCHRYPAPWNRIRRLNLGPARSAGSRRNTVMRERHDILGAIAFHDDLANSKGTKNMVEQLKKLRVDIEYVSH
jgi:hypothetical protein